MPIYEYRCDDCERVFEAIQRLSEEPLDACQHCGGSARRIISSPAIHFVGSGWYVTDYARKAGDKGANGKNGSSTKDGAAGETASGKDSGAGTSPKKAGKPAAAASGAKPRSSRSESPAGSPS